jgi:uncharacterized protein YecA (UPF0149 family)
MDIRTGKIFDANEMAKLDEEDKQYLREMNRPLTVRQKLSRRVHRNDLCPCGSGKKFKKCCLLKKG